MNEFRTDINGLRAWAVIAVILFHFGVPGFSGGFVGVDIFFVISGYLMTGIIFKKLSSDTKFSLFDFYLARSRRILPALLFLCFFLMLVGRFFLPSIHYEQLSKHVISAALFISNITFWSESGYFDVSSHQKLLLHSWSLSVEWQFYIFFPIVLLIFWKLIPNKSFMAWMLIIGVLVSFALSIAANKRYPSETFYLLPFRAWELLIGGLIFHYGAAVKLDNKSRIVIEFFGVTLILFSITTFTGEIAWPGYLTLIPVIGCSMILIANRYHSIFTGNTIAQWLGKISYSVYLWHWPLAVLLLISGNSRNTSLIILSIMMSILLGWLSWRFIEEPFRFALTSRKRASQLGVTLVFLGLLIAPSYWVYHSKGDFGQYSPDIDQIFAESKNINPKGSECSDIDRLLKNPCRYGGEDLGAIVIGDSHAMAVVRAIQSSLPSSEQHVLDLTANSCPTIANIKSIKTGSECGKFVEDFINKLTQTPNNVPILIVNRISAYIEGPNERERTAELPTPDNYLSEPFTSRSQDFYDELQQGIIESACRMSVTHPVYLMRPVPELKDNVPSTMGWSTVFGKTQRVVLSKNEYSERHRLTIEAQNQAAEKCGVHILDPLPLLCDEEFCYGDFNGRPIYYDDDHLSLFGAELLKPLWQEMFKKH